MKWLLASKMGFVFLLFAAMLVGLFLASVWTGAYVGFSEVALSYGYGSVFGWYRSGSMRSPEMVFRFEFTSGWRWESAMWPRIYHVVATPKTSGEEWLVIVPIWMLLVPSAWLSWFFYRRSRRNRLIGHCPNCEYDLTGNTSGVCPECGERL